MEGNWDYEPTLTYWKDYMVKFCFTLCFNVSFIGGPKSVQSPTVGLQPYWPRLAPSIDRTADFGRSKLEANNWTFKYAIFVSVKALVYLVPDRPWQLEEKIKIEQYLIR